MTNYTIDNGQGDQITAGLQDHNVYKVARTIAAERGETVYVYPDDDPNAVEAVHADGTIENAKDWSRAV